MRSAQDSLGEIESQGPASTFTSCTVKSLIHQLRAATQPSLHMQARCVEDHTTPGCPTAAHPVGIENKPRLSGMTGLADRPCAVAAASVGSTQIVMTSHSNHWAPVHGFDRYYRIAPIIATIHAYQKRNVLHFISAQYCDLSFVSCVSKHRQHAVFERLKTSRQEYGKAIVPF
jgi:hypothetical protein